MNFTLTLIPFISPEFHRDIKDGPRWMINTQDLCHDWVSPMLKLLIIYGGLLANLPNYPKIISYWLFCSNCSWGSHVNPKRNQSWILIGRTDAEAETPILWPPDAKSWLIWKHPDAGKDRRQEEGTTEDEMVGWHHRLNGHEFEQAPGVGDGQGGLACCSPRGHKESDTTEPLNWTELKQEPGLIGTQTHDKSGCGGWEKPAQGPGVSQDHGAVSQEGISTQGSSWPL